MSTRLTSSFNCAWVKPSSALNALVSLVSTSRLLRSRFGVQTLLHEGGPTPFGQFLGAEAVDEVFLTLSPQIAGRKGDSIRPALSQAVEFMPDSAPWFQLFSVKQKAEHMYLRYRRTGIRPSM
jgi:riboflavin biosynthesis pyrimidine reductase